MRSPIWKQKPHGERLSLVSWPLAHTHGHGCGPERLIGLHALALPCGRAHDREEVRALDMHSDRVHLLQGTSQVVDLFLCVIKAGRDTQRVLLGNRAHIDLVLILQPVGDGLRIIPLKGK